MVQVRFIGSGDAFGTGGRFNTCFQVTHGQGCCLIDCGASSLVALNKFGVHPNTVDAIFLSHLHGDHFGGVPFLLLDVRIASRRDRPLLIAGPPGTEKRVNDTLECLFPGASKREYRFSLTYAELKVGETFRHGPYAVTPFPAMHEAGVPCYALRLEVGGKTIAYSGDGAWGDGLLGAAKGADLFIAETYFHDKKLSGHMDYATLAPRLPEIAAKRVILTHFGPDMIGRLDGFPAETAEDGLTVEI
ncbi:MAG: MBL fold metallo-hydrolase [Alphaproteobacteria bacterium]|nr:MBL fold metallo-hydrolase [Alphaproteobacteria bacterium]